MGCMGKLIDRLDVDELIARELGNILGLVHGIAGDIQNLRGI